MEYQDGFRHARCVRIDGWLPESVRADLVRGTAERLVAMKIAGIDLPTIRAGTIGSDARSLGAASLPLSERFLLDPDALFRA